MKTPTNQSLLAALIIFSASLAFASRAFAQGGVPLWTNRYDGPGRDDDVPKALAVDGSGNLIVTGSTTTANGYTDYATVKYSSAGVPLWTNSFDGGNDNNDGATAVAVDSSGKVFVTGYSDTSGGTPQCATLAYSSAGVPLWTNWYSGGSGGADASAVGVNSNGNVFVTGRSSSNGTDSDYATLAYSNTGVPLWTNRYDGGNSLDEAFALAVDNSGKVFVTGRSLDTNSLYYSYVTISYSDLGVPLWTNRYGIGEAWAIAVDGNGNVFVTGNPATIKYSNTGVPLWTNRLAYTGRRIAVDGSGNVFVSTDYPIVTYSNAGVPLWTNGVGGSIMAADSIGNVFVAGSSAAVNGYDDYLTIGYSSAGVPLWTNRYNGPGNRWDEATAIAVDMSGNVFVTGISSSTNSYPDRYDFVTIKYSSSIPSAHLDFQKLNNQLVLSWTNGNFSLQSAPFVPGTFTNVPGATSPYTNSFSAPRQFFRLIGN